MRIGRLSHHEELDSEIHGVTGTVLGTEDKGVSDGVASLDGLTLLPLAQIPATLTGKDTDTVDGYHAAVAGGLATISTNLDAPHLIKKTSSANLRHSHDAEASTAVSAPLQELKTITFPHGLAGTARIDFEIKNANNSTTVYGVVYKNEAEIGSWQNVTSSTYANKSQNLTTNIEPGGTLGLWGKGNGDTVYVRNFRVYYDDNASIVVESANS